MSCLTEHDKNKAYQSANINLLSNYLWVPLQTVEKPYALLCLACFVCNCLLFTIKLLLLL